MAQKIYLKKVVLKKEIRTAEFLHFLSAKQKKELLALAHILGGRRVVHINATQKGGGVAEILKSLIPYLRSLGLQSDWYYINPILDKNFFAITNKIHNALQGSLIKIKREEWAEYERVSKSVAMELDAIDCDILVIHDPQPLLAGVYCKLNKKKIFFSHIDTSEASDAAWKKLYPMINSYYRIVFSNRNFIHNHFSGDKIKVFTPAIDPLSPKQQIVSKKESRLYLKKYAGIMENVPLIAQISRFDEWKNPIGVLEAFKIIKIVYPKALLMLVGFKEASDNPLAKKSYEKVVAAASNASGIRIFFNSKGKNILEFTTMAQNAADIIVQNSIKEGFGLTVSEAMWKSHPVIGGPALGIRKQIKNGKNGFIVKNPDELAQKILFLLSHPKKKKKMGSEAKKTVRERFLFPRLVLDHLKLYKPCLK